MRWPFDWDTDTRDYGDHLNYYGATKASRAVADILHDRYGLQDHRADGGDTYRHWNRAVRAYERQIEEAERFNATCLAPLGSDLRATLPLEGRGSERGRLEGFSALRHPPCRTFLKRLSRCAAANST